MNKTIIFVLIFSLLLFGIQQKSSASGNVFGEMLENVGLSSEKVGWDPMMLSRLDSDPFRLQWFNELWSNPLKLPRISKQMTERIPLYCTNKTNDLNMIFMYGSAKTCGYVGAFFDQYLPPLPIDEKKPLAEAVRTIYKNHHWRFGKTIEGEIGDYEMKVGPELSTLIAEYILSADFLHTERKKAFTLATLDETLYRKALLLMTDEETDGSFLWKLAKDLDAKQLMYACCRVVFASQKLKNAATGGKLTLPEEELFFETPLGNVSLDGTRQDSIINGSNWLLTIDTGGNDIYNANVGATSSLENCASLSIDLGGMDFYLCQNEAYPSFGAGILGCGILVDLGKEDDRYEGYNNSQGTGLMGIGILSDAGGNDTRKAVDFSQGAGFFGIGALTDLEGNDTNECFFGGQGYGSTMGMGICFDASGNDTYTSNDTDIIHPSAQNPNHNTSMAQGCGNGRRADITDGHSMSGGVGLLVDTGGDDKYSCGVFGQGVGYWYGVGILTDTDGNDQYSGLWYVQGATAHFAVSVFRDEKGDDVYEAKQATSIGVGHDFSSSFHIDKGGDDTYNCFRTEKDEKGEDKRIPGGLMLGCGNDTGMGFFFNIGGNDAYNGFDGRMYGGAYVSAPTTPDTMRNEALCLGVFLDIGGKDKYGTDFAKENSSWLRKDKARPDVVIGIGQDTESGEVPFLY